MQKHEASKTKSGRPSALSLEEQLLLALTYWREYRTLYHISMDFGIHWSSASRIIRKVEDILVDSGKFELLKKLPCRVDDDINWQVVIVDATETPIERPKKTKETTQRQEKTTHLKSAGYPSLANRFDIRYSNV